MIYEMIIEEGKEKPVINFLKQLDFVTIKSVKKTSKQKVEKINGIQNDLPYFGACPEWEMDVKEMRKNNTKKRIEGWL
jgi:hypothetical protein